jgi:hypothetical protein
MKRALHFRSRRDCQQVFDKRYILAEGEARMKREHTAVKVISEATTGAPAGLVSL